MTDNDPRTAARECFERLTKREQIATLNFFRVVLLRKAGAVQPPEPPADVAPVDAFDAGDGAALADAVDAFDAGDGAALADAVDAFDAGDGAALADAVDAFDAGDGAALADAVDAWLQSEVAP